MSTCCANSRLLVFPRPSARRWLKISRKSANSHLIIPIKVPNKISRLPSLADHILGPLAGHWHIPMNHATTASAGGPAPSNLTQPTSPRKSYFQYDPLPGDPRRYIRILTIHPGAFDDDIKLSLDVDFFDLDSPPVYEALSYTWGSQRNRKSVGLGEGSTISIRKNLFVALRHLRYEGRPRLMWIDALCINQKDDSEKNPQVAMMGDIFRLAARVIAWLGPEENKSDLAMDCMEDVGSQVDVHWGTHRMRPSRNSTDRTLADRNIVLPLFEDDLTAVYHLLNRHWFERLWIRQEIFLANPKALVCCGHSQILWRDFRVAMYCIATKPKRNFVLFDKLYSRSLYLWPLTKQVGFPSLVDHKYLFSNASCSDPRDRIFAVRALMNEKDRWICGLPDYSKDAAMIFQEIALRYFKTYSLSLLSVCESGTQNDTISAPSWVPDWSSHHTKNNRGTDYVIFHRASSSLSSWWKFHEPNILEVAGVSVAKIESRSQSLEFPERITAQNDWNYIRDVIKDNGGLATSDYRTGISIEEAYSRILIEYRFEESQDPPLTNCPSISDAHAVMKKLVSGFEHPGDEFDISAGESRFLGEARHRMDGKCLLYCEGGYIGLGPSTAQLNDEVCVLLGCVNPMVLRPIRDGKYLVVGPCYVEGVSHGEALLGPLPKNVRPVYKYYASHNGYRWGFVDDVTGAFTAEDPRLESLGIDLGGFRERLRERPGAQLDVDLDVLRNRGVDIKHFNLV